MPTAAHIKKLEYIGAQIATCDAKVHFVTKGKAMRAADTIKVTHHRSLNPYRCPVCNEWHLTSGSAITRTKL